ncbi:MAG: ARPP-1 family domain-containing protein [Ignavibacterium sp.]|uniref:ARPP-1 family domain-containing protein n=1 Tax=Ignavibacterium sp. TaxID=2651167 RepID=UPI00404AFBAA
MQLKIHSFHKNGRLSVLQFSTPENNTFDYISGPSAIAKNYVEVREVSSAGSVNNLELINTSDKYIFFLDGDILTGAKQNRVLNTSVFIAPNSRLIIPVSCVEQGRWSSISLRFMSATYISPDTFRAKMMRSVNANLRKGRGYDANQIEVWNEVNNYIHKFKAISATSDFTNVYRNRDKDFNEFSKNFIVDKNSNGVAIFVDNSPLGIDIFNRTDIYQEYFPKRLKSVALEVFNLKDKENTITEAEANYKTLALFDELEKVQFTMHDGVGIGKEKRFDNDKYVALELTYLQHLIHFTLLSLTTVN